LLFVEKNTWGFVPFSHAFAGFGQQVTAIEEDDPSYLAVGILEPVMASLRAQAQAVAGRHNALLDATFNPLGTTMDAAELQEQLARGDIIEMGTRGDAWRMEIPQLPRWLFASEEWLDRDIEQGTFSRALAGVREQGVSTVGQQAILSTAAGRKFVAPSRQLEHLATKSASHILQWIDVIGMTLTVQGHQITPADIQKILAGEVMKEAGLLDLIETQREAQEGGQGAGPGMGGGGMPGTPSPGMNGGGGQPPVLGPDGMPLQQTMGTPPGPAGAARELRQPLTPNTARPSRVGQNLAG
jgi:hypothetical protein